jgi:hypothetical protein
MLKRPLHPVRVLVAGASTAVIVCGIGGLLRLFLPSFIQIPIAPSSPRGVSIDTLDSSTTDVTDATIPEDAPFRTYTEGHSLLAARGLKITETDKGVWRVDPAQSTNLQFPIAPPKYAFMPAPELRGELRANAKELRRFQERFLAEFQQAEDDAKRKEIITTYGQAYEDKFADLSLALASAAIGRIPSGIPARSTSATNGAEIIYYKKFVGPQPAANAADFLDFLADNIPGG